MYQKFVDKQQNKRKNWFKIGKIHDKKNNNQENQENNKKVSWQIFNGKMNAQWKIQFSILDKILQISNLILSIKQMISYAQNKIWRSNNAIMEDVELTDVKSFLTVTYLGSVPICFIC